MAGGLEKKMKTLRMLSILIVLAVLFTLAGAPTDVAARPNTLGISYTWGAAGSYSVLAGQSVTNAGATTMPGDLGVSPGAGAINVTGFPPGLVGPPGVINDVVGTAAAAMADFTTAMTFLDQLCDTTYAAPQDLVGLSLVPGVYCSPAFTLTGTLTLTGGAGEVYIFKSGATIITGGTANIVGGDPCNIWWRAVSSVTLGVGTSMTGNVLADTSLGMVTGATLNGRAFARTGSVTLDTNVITNPVCLVAPVVPPVVPPVVGLPDTGGAPIRSEAFSWTLVIAGIGISAVALVLGVRGTRRNRLPKQ